MKENIVIVGAGLAGATAARTLRSEGHTGPVILVGSERHNPYIRPPLSKDYLLGKEGEDKAAVVPPDWYAENDVDLRLGVSVTGIRPDAGTVQFNDGTSLPYQSLLLATGAVPAPFRCRGASCQGSPRSAPSMTAAGCGSSWTRADKTW